MGADGAGGGRGWVHRGRSGVAGSGVRVLSAELWAVGLSLLAVAWRKGSGV